MALGEFKLAKWLDMLAERISMIGSYLWIQLIMFARQADLAALPS